MCECINCENLCIKNKDEAFFCLGFNEFLEEYDLEADEECVYYMERSE